MEKLQRKQFSVHLLPDSPAIRLASIPLGLSSFIDELPEVLRIRESFVFAEREFRAEEEVRKGTFVENPVDDDMHVGDPEIKAPVLAAEAIEGLSVTLDFAKALVVEIFQIICGHLEFIQEFKLFQSPELGDFGGTNFIEDDLKHSLMMTGIGGNPIVKNARISVIAMGDQPLAFAIRKSTSGWQLKNPGQKL